MGIQLFATVLIISRTQYSPQALFDFWRRVAVDESVHAKYEYFSRSLSPQERVAMLEKLNLKPPEGTTNSQKTDPVNPIT